MRVSKNNQVYPNDKIETGKNNHYGSNPMTSTLPPNVKALILEMDGFGVPTEPWQVGNPFIALADYLSKQFPGAGR